VYIIGHTPSQTSTTTAEKLGEMVFTRCSMYMGLARVRVRYNVALMMYL